MGSLFAMAQKEVRHLFRDKRTVALVTFLPLIQLILFGFAVDLEVKHLRIAVQDEDQSALSRRLVSAFEQSEDFDVVKKVRTPADLREALDQGVVKASLHIPPNFAKDVLAGRQAQLPMLIDGTDSTPATAAQNSGSAIVTAFLQKEGLAAVSAQQIDFRPRMWYNPDLKSPFFFLPGLVGFLLTLLIPLTTATAIVREKENGNIEQLLVTPIRPWQIMFGKIIPYIAIGLIIATTILTGARLIFHVPVRGNLVTLYGLTLLYLIVLLGFGLFASTAADTQQQASQIIIASIGPSVLLSGFIFPRENMPLPLNLIGNVIPLTHYLVVIRGVTLKGLTSWQLRRQIALLSLMAAGLLFGSVRKFHKRLT